MRRTTLLMLSGFIIARGVIAADFTVTSPQLKENGRIADEQVYLGMGCQGGNVSPALRWTGAPPATKSFAVTVYDPDAPTGSGWWHWLIFNIPANVNSLPKDAGNPQSKLAPPGSVQSRTDYGGPGYGGPCPPRGDKPHRYEFTVYALKVDKLTVDENAPAAQVGFQIRQNMIGKGVLTATYGR